MATMHMYASVASRTAGARVTVRAARSGVWRAVKYCRAPPRASVSTSEPRSKSVRSCGALFKRTSHMSCPRASVAAHGAVRTRRAGLMGGRPARADLSPRSQLECQKWDAPTGCMCQDEKHPLCAAALRTMKHLINLISINTLTSLAPSAGPL